VMALHVVVLGNRWRPVMALHVVDALVAHDCSPSLTPAR
jgi:hypothetical protein